MFRRTLLCVGALASVLASSASAQTVTVAGSSTVRPVVEKASEAFQQANPGVKFVIGGGGSSTGVKAAGNGDVMLGMASRELKDKEVSEFPSLVAHKIAVDGVAVFVNAKNGSTALTKEQVQKIYTGEITNWNQLGGSDEAIVPVSKTENHGTHDLFLKYFDLECETIGEGKEAQMRFRVKGTDAWGSVMAVATDANKDTFANVLVKPGAVAYIGVGNAETMAAKSGRLKLLSLDGVQASTENVENGSYPLVRPLQVLTNGQPEEVVSQFISFLRSDEGSQIIRDLGFTPLSGTATASVPTE